MAAKRISDEYLLDIYREYIGEPDDRRDVYLGFGLFLGGIALATVAFLLFIWSSTLEARSSAFFAWVQPAYALGMLSLPVVMLGIVVLLPSERRVLYASVVGVSVTLLAVVGFTILYPQNWNFYESGDAAFSTVHVVAIYAIGLASITASTGAALIAHYLDLAASVETAATQPDAEEAETYTDEEIREDIDQAMEDVELSWGGVEKTENRRLEFATNEFEDAEVEFTAKTTRSSGVDSQVAGLKGLKGGEKKTATSKGTVDDQTQKLKELRQKQQAESVATASETDTGLNGFIAKLLALLRGNK